MHATEETLTTIGKQVLEMMAFAFEMPSQDKPAVGEDTLRATVGFNGPVRGTFSLTLPRALLPELVANMLGKDEGAVLPEQQQYDALGELANVICGNLVQAMAGPLLTFRLDSPQIDLNPTPTGTGAASTACIMLESGWAELALDVEDGPVDGANAPVCVPATSAR